ncbi:MAG: GNAT family N-acetyltransferase [Acidimicrobiales bacterium]
MSSPPTIFTSRLLLVPLLEETLEALIIGDRAAARAAQDLDFTAEFIDSLGYEFLKVQLSGVQRRGAESGWFVRAVLRKDDATIIGDCGFHGAPEDVGRAEIGYRILPRYRANGFASEAASGLVAWAREQGAPRRVRGGESLE